MLLDNLGGVSRYCDFVGATLEPKRSDHAEMLHGCGGRFDAYSFDIDSVNAQLERVNI